MKRSTKIALAVVAIRVAGGFVILPAPEVIVNSTAVKPEIEKIGGNGNCTADVIADDIPLELLADFLSKAGKPAAPKKLRLSRYRWKISRLRVQTSPTPARRLPSIS